MRKPQANLEPDELFQFLNNHDDYPVSGLSLAHEARQEDAAPELVEFFEALPTVKDESEVVKHAIDPKEAPLGKKLNLQSEPAQPPDPSQSEADAILTIEDIVK